MKTFLIGLISGISLLMGSTATAEVLGEAVDSYIGFQMTIPLGEKRESLFSGKAEYSALIIDQTDGIKTGITFTQDIYGNQIMGYVSPSHTFEVGQSRVSDYTFPIINLSEGSIVGTNQAEITGEDVAVGALVVVGALAVGALIAVKVAAEAAECITGAACTPSCCISTD